MIEKRVYQTYDRTPFFQVIKRTIHILAFWCKYCAWNKTQGGGIMLLLLLLGDFRLFFSSFCYAVLYVT